jgi:hypothetical protein
MKGSPKFWPTEFPSRLWDRSEIPVTFLVGSKVTQNIQPSPQVPWTEIYVTRKWKPRTVFIKNTLVITLNRTIQTKAT